MLFRARTCGRSFITRTCTTLGQGMRRGGLERLCTMNHRWLWMVLLSAVAIGLAACGPKKAAETPEPRPVRTVTAKPQESGEKVVLTGHIQAEDEASMAF